MTIVAVDEDFVLEKGNNKTTTTTTTMRTSIQSSSSNNSSSTPSSDDKNDEIPGCDDDVVERVVFNKRNEDNNLDKKSTTATSTTAENIIETSSSLSQHNDVENNNNQKQIMGGSSPCPGGGLLRRQNPSASTTTWSRSNSSVRFKDIQSDEELVVVATSTHGVQQEEDDDMTTTNRRRSNIREWALEQKSKRDGLLLCNKDSCSSKTSRTADSTAYWLQRGTSKSDSDEEEDSDKEEVEIMEEAALTFRGKEEEEGTAASMQDTAADANNNRGENKQRQLRRKSSFSRWAMKSNQKLFGDDYTGREGLFVIVSGALIAFNTGYVNGSCLSGLVSPTGDAKQSVAGFSGTYTKSALALADGEFNDFFFHSNMILSYMFGSLISGFLTPNETPYRIEPSYGPTFLIGGVFLLISSILAAIEFDEKYVWFFAAAANGIQNGIASIYSKNLIRCSLTGASTDIALVIGQMLRGNRKKLLKGLILSLIVVSFWLGGIISLYATTYFRTYSLFVNATLFWLIGIALIYFLVSELHVTVRAAVLGSWDWKIAIKQLSKQMIRESMMQQQQQQQQQTGGHNNMMDSNDFDLISLNSMDYDELFDRIDVDGDGHLEEHEMLDALTNAGMDISLSRIKALIKAADIDNDGTIDRQEWKMVCKSL